MELLAEELNDHPIFTWRAYEDDDFQDNFTVKLVHIEGPFEHIPPGVTLIDTPGLGDSSICRSYRTLDIISTVNVVWYACPITYCMGRLWIKRYW